MADFELIVGVEHSTSYAEMKKGIEQLVSELNSQESFKIKVEIDRNSSGEIKSDVKQISDGISNSLSKDLVKGVNKIADSLENLSKNGAESIANITNRLTEMLDVITKINAKDFNMSNVLNFGGNGAGRKELSLYKDEALELVRVINKMEEAVRGASGKAFAAIYSNRVASGNYGGFLKEWGSGLTDAQKAINKASTVSSMEGLIGGYSALRDRISEIYTLAKSADPLLPNIDTSALEEATKKVNDLQDAQERTRERIVESITGASTTTNGAAGDSTEKLKELPEMIKTPLDEIRAQLEKTFDLSTIDMHTDAVKEQISSLTKEIGKLSNSRGGSGSGSDGSGKGKASDTTRQETDKIIKDINNYYKWLTDVSKLKTSDLGIPTHGGSASYSEGFDNYVTNINAAKMAIDDYLKEENLAKLSDSDRAKVLDALANAQRNYELSLERTADKEVAAAQKDANKAIEEWETRERAAEEAARSTNTALQDQIDAVTGVSKETKSASESADAMKMAWAMEDEEIKKATQTINEYTRVRKFAISNDAATQGADGTWTATSENYEGLANRLNALRTSYDSLTSAETKSTQSARVQEAVIEKVMQAEEELNLAKMKASDTTRKETAEGNKRSTMISRGIELQKKYANAISNWTAARNGRSSGAYSAIEKDKASLDKYVEMLNNGKISVGEFSKKYDEFKNRFTQNSTVISDAGENVKAFGDRVGGMVEKFSQWFSMTRIIMAVYRSLKQLVSAAMEVDKSMTQLQIVTRESDAVMARFADTAADAAKRVGSSITDFVDSATTFARLGYSLDESAALAEYTTMLQNVGDIDVQDAQDAITAIVKAFKIDADDIEDVMNKLVITGNNFPISVKQIADGMNNASSALAASGNTFEQSVALMTAANTTVQNASKASTGLRTIAARLRNTTSELDELGETMEKAKYEELVQQLTDYNISLTDAMGNYRSTYDIMKDIAAMWGELSSMEKSALATAIAGTRQQAIFFSIVEQFQEASGAMDAMADSAGALDKAYSTYLESTEAHINQFKAAFQDIGQDLFKQDFLTGIIEKGTQLLGLVDGVVKLVNAMGGLNTVLPVTIALVAALNLNKIIGLAGALGKKIIDIFANSAIVKGPQALAAGIHALESGTKGAQAAFAGLGGTMTIVTGAISTLTAVISVAVLAYSSFRQAQEEARRSAISNGEATASLGNELLELAASYRETEAGIEDGTKTKEDLNSVTDALIDKLGIERSELKKTAASFTDYKEAIKDAMVMKRGSMQVDLDAALVAAGQQLGEDFIAPGEADWLKGLAAPFYKILGLFGERTSVGSFFTLDQSQVKEYQKALEAIEPFISNRARDADSLEEIFTIGDAYTDDPNSMIAAYNELGEAMGKLSENGYRDTVIFEQLSKQYIALSESVTKYRDAVKASNENLAAEYFETETLNETLPQTQEEFDALREKIIDGIILSDRYGGTIGDIESAVDSVLYAYPELREFFEVTGEDANRGLHSISGFTSSLTDLKDKLESMQSAYDVLHSAESEMIANGEISLDTIKALAKVTDDYANYLYTENGAIKLNTEAWKEYAENGLGSSISQSEEALEKLREENALIKENIATLNNVIPVEDDHEGELEEGAWRASELNDELEKQTELLKKNEEAIASETNRLSLFKAVYDGVVESQSSSNLENVTSYLSGLSNSLSTVADLQRAVADGFTMSLDEALKFADVYPQILDAATASADGQITLNEDVVNAIISGKQAEVQASIDAKIQDLEAVKEELEAKKAFAEAQLAIAENVGTGEGQISRDLAEYRIKLSNELVKGLIENGMSEKDAYYTVIDAMGGFLGDFGTYAGQTSSDMAANMSNAAKTMGDSVYRNALRAIQDIVAIGKSAHDTSVQVENIDKGVSTSYNPNYKTSGGGVNANNFTIVGGPGTFTIQKGGQHVSVDDTLDGFAADLKLDIESYEKEIAKIDAQIGLLKGLRGWSPGGWSAGSKGSGGSGGGSSGSGGSSSKEAESEIDDWFKREYALHNHYLAMDQESVSDFIDWLDDAYKRAYDEGLIDLDGYYKYEEEVYKKRQDLFKDYLSDTEHEISMRENFEGETNKILSLYDEMMSEIEDEIADARKRGLTDEDDYIQELQSKWSSYKDARKKLEEDIEKNAVDATKELVNIRVQMLKQDIQNEREALSERRRLLKEFYDDQKQMLQDQHDEETYLKDQADKRKKITDIQLQLNALERDDSAAAEKKKLELRQQLVDAQEELAEFERDHALKMAQEQLDNLYEMQDKELEAEDKLLEEQENDTKALYEKALEDIKNGSADLYKEMIEWNNKYGDGIEATITDKWEAAYKALKDYRDLYNKPYEGFNLDNATNYQGSGESWNKAPVSGGSKGGSSSGSGSGGKSSGTKKSGGTGSGSKSGSGGGSTGSKSGSGSGDPVTDEVKRKVAAAIWNKATASGWGRNPERAKRLEEVFGKNNGIQELINQGVGKMDPYPGDAYSYLAMRKKYKGYWAGTSSATAGLHRIDELGTETIFQSADGSRYKMFTGGEKVLNANASDFLYKFANGGSELFARMFGGLGGGFNGIASGAAPTQIIMGDIIIQGSADKATVSEIRRAQRDSVQNLLKEFGRLSK